MHRVIAVLVVVLGAFAAGALAQQSHNRAAVSLRIVSPSGESTTFALDRGDVTLTIAESDVRLAVKGNARMTTANRAGDPGLEMTNPTLVYARSAGGKGAGVQFSADEVRSGESKQ